MFSAVFLRNFSILLLVLLMNSDSVHFSLSILWYTDVHIDTMWVLGKGGCTYDTMWVLGVGWMCISLSEGAGKGGPRRVSLLREKTEKGMLLKSYTRTNAKCF